MRIADMLIAIANWLESPENEALLLAEYNEDCMEKVAVSCIAAASVLKKCADEVDVMEDKRRLLVSEAKQLLQALAATPLDIHELTVDLFDGEEAFSTITATPSQIVDRLASVEMPEDITATISLVRMVDVDGQTVEKIAKLASALDMSSDASMQKQASVIDELLLGVAAPSDWAANFKAAQSKKLDEIKKVYQGTNEKIHEVIGVEDAKKAIDKSEYNKEYELPKTGLSTRVCPDHFSPMARVGENVFQCPLDKHVYDFNAGFTDEQGVKHKPAGSDAIAMQTKRDSQFHQIFDNRQERLDKMR